MYDWKITIWKGAKYTVYYGLGLGIAYLTTNPEFAPYLGITIGSALTMIRNWIKKSNWKAYLS